MLTRAFPRAGVVFLIAVLLASVSPRAYAADNLQADDRAQTTIYVVRRGDTLSAISRRFGVSVAAIKRANGLKSDRILVGQRLKIPAAPAVSGASCGRTYQVKRGDTLAGIARKCGVSVARIRELNNLPNNRIRIGQNLILRSTAPSREPPGPPGDAPPNTPTPSPTWEKELQPPKS